MCRNIQKTKLKQWVIKNGAERLMCWAALTMLASTLMACKPSADEASVGGGDDETAAAVQLSWTAPTSREDGSPLSMSELGGYKLKYGTESGVYSHEIDIDDPYVTEYQLRNLAPDEYYFAVVAYDVNGIASTPSNETVKTVTH